MTTARRSPPRSWSATPATSCSARWAAPGSSASRRRACSSSARAGSARRSRSISRRPASARSASSTTMCVSLSNLQRQIIHRTDKIGAPKVESARETLAALNPHVAVVPHEMRLTAENARELHRRLRRRRRRLRQFRHALSRRRYLRRAENPAGDGGGRPLRRFGDGAEALRGRQSRPIATSFPRRRRRACCRPAPRPAFSAR